MRSTGSGGDCSPRWPGWDARERAAPGFLVLLVVGATFPVPCLSVMNMRRRKMIMWGNRRDYAGPATQEGLVLLKIVIS